jgi:hypothetical protein
MASSSVAQLTMDSFDTYLNAEEANAPKHPTPQLADEVLSDQDRQQPPTHEQVHHWRELAGAMTLRGAGGMPDGGWPAELAPSQTTLTTLVDRHLIVRRGRAWHLRRNWYLRLQAFRQIAVETPPLSVLERPEPNLPTYAELKGFETICRSLDVLPRSRSRLPFTGLSVGMEGEVPITTLKLMRRYHLVQHTSTCEWKLSPRWQQRLNELWRGVQAALRDRGVPNEMTPLPRALVAGIDTWHLNWLVEHPLPGALRERLDRWQDQAREEETELETDLVYDGAPLVMYRWGTKAEGGKERAGVTRSFLHLLRQVGEEEFIHDAGTRDASSALLVAGWIGGHHATWYALRPHRHLWAVIEAAHKQAFRMLLQLIGRQVQTHLDERMIKHRVLFAARHESEASQIRQHGPGARLDPLIDTPPAPQSLAPTPYRTTGGPS